ncbi:hypothetical protein [Agromyces agglutinans]|uniref:hypothetical protein n=1 Tax=Agromyces agglutinans TaxID=2662258 RepID=UPI001FE296FC|nr:hypothetical protein [Agromyces agglutinans]
MPDRVHRITSMRTDAPQEPGATQPGEPTPGATQPGEPTPGEPRAHGFERSIDAVLGVQRPVVVAHLRGIRRRHPDATPERLVRILEQRYLAAVTTGGAAVGATAVVPGIGTGVTLALSGVETAGFLEATALFAQSVAEVHGIPVENPERARALVMTLMLGSEGTDLVRQFAAQATGRGVARNAYWGEVITNTLPKAVMGSLVDGLRRTFIKQFAVRGGAGWIGKALPFGIGAAIGGIGNHVLGRRVLTQSRLAFGQAPPVLPAELEPRGDEGLVVTAGRRVGGAVGGTIGGFAKASARGIRAVGGATGRAARGALGRRGGDADAGADAGADAADVLSASRGADPAGPTAPADLGETDASPGPRPA